YNPRNVSFGKSFYKNLFDRTANPDRRIGRAVLRAKQQFATDGNSYKYFLFGDPATRLMMPRQEIAVSRPDTLRRLERIDIPGTIEGVSGGAATIRVKAFGPKQHKVYKTPDVEISYTQPIPLGARNVRMEGSAEMGRGREGVGRHDGFHEVTFSLREEAPVELRYLWEGGLEVEPPATSVPLGVQSGGLRILDFFQEGDRWVLLLEGDGGSRHPLRVFGDTVETTDGQASIPSGFEGGTTIFVDFTGSGRIQRTLRLQRVR
ncbi:MAG: C25 family cysteine peptidase, partial [Longimicrobiales bacterium]